MDDNYRPSRDRDDSRDRDYRRHRDDDYEDRHRDRSGSPGRDRRSRRSPEANGHRDREYRDRSYNDSYNGSSRAPPPQRSFEERAQHKAEMIDQKREESQQDRRVYVGNLSYDVQWKHLKDFMRTAGEVHFADVLLLPNGMSKGCGIVEYTTREGAQNAINTLSNQNLMGRLIYVREDRETEPRFNNAAPAPRGGGYGGGFGGGRGGGFGMRGGYGGGGGFGGGFGGSQGGGNQIFISNLPFQVGWQDLKDLFRQAVMNGQILRADVHSAPDGRPKGSGTVAFDNPDDAANAIQQFNGYDWQGRILEVREDRYAGGPGAGFGGRGGYGGGFGGRGGFGMRGGGFGGRGGFGGAYGGGGRGGFGGGGYGGGAGGFGGGAPAAAAQQAPNPFVDFSGPGNDPCPIIFVRNLPWSTSDDDLVELFTTIGKVVRAEIKREPNGRSSGTGVVEFETQDDAATAISKFSGYNYGNRPLGLSYCRYANAGDEMQGQESTGQMQAEMM